MLSTLYKKTAKGATQTWRVAVDGNKITVYHGQLGGKIQETVTICSGKNLGKANETSPEQQAQREAAALWLKQIQRRGYTEDSTLSNIEFRPMLALDYTKVGHRIDWNDSVYVQAKLDGLRCYYDGENLYSRTGKVYDVPHIKESLKSFDTKGCILDGELYVHELPLNQINSCVNKHNDNTLKVRYYIFDVYKEGYTFSERYDYLTEEYGKWFDLSSDEDKERIVLLPSHKTKKDKLDKVLDILIENGFEGVMLRQGAGMYTPGKRSKDLMKYKRFKDSDYKIIDVNEDKDGCGVLVCVNENGSEFNVRCSFPDEERRELFVNKSKYKGMYVTVKYQEISEYGIPIFPVGVAILKKGDK